MERRISKKSLTAILFASVWMLFVLCFSLPVCPAEKAHAVASSSMDQEVIVRATDLDTPGGGSAGETYEWGIFYRGMGVLTDVSYQPGGNDQGGTITWDDIDNDNGEVLLTIPDRNSPLYNHSHQHDFINGNFEYIDSNTHWAVCPDCGFKLQVAHRPDSTGTCTDCNEELGENYVNSYTFTIPDEIPFEDAEWTEDEPSSVAFPVSLDANLYAGVTLQLLMQCTNGAFISENSESIGYKVSVTDDSGYGTGEAYDASELTSGPQVIWELMVEEDTEYDGTDDYLRKIISLTITVILEVPEENLQDLVYAGSFSDTLAFSAKLTEETS